MNIIKETKIGAHYACALLYGDHTGMTDEEDIALEKWEAQFDPIKPLVFDFLDQEDEFGRCDVDGMMGTVIPVTVYQCE